MKKAFKILIRLIVAPLIFCIIFIAYLYHAIMQTISFVGYGGEWITYRKEEPHTIKQIFDELKKCEVVPFDSTVKK